MRGVSVRSFPFENLSDMMDLDSDQVADISGITLSERVWTAIQTVGVRVKGWDGFVMALVTGD